MPTQYKLSREQEQQIIEWAVQQGIVQAEEAEVKPKLLIDKYGLMKLFWNTKFREAKPAKKMPQLIVRCNRETEEWMVMVHGAKNPKRHMKGSLVISDVQFVHKKGHETIETTVNLGCGITDTENVEVHTGFATGQYAPHIKPTKAAKGGKHLRYDREQGCFFDSETGTKVDRAAYLVLLEACKHAYIPIPGQ